jgi:phosphate starvation-inducible PhoH-like protein
VADDQEAPAEQLFEQLSFDDNRHVASLSGEHDAHLLVIERAFGVRIDPRGNVLNISGPPAQRAQASAVLSRLYERLAAGQLLTVEDVRAAAKFSSGDAAPGAAQGIAIKTPKRLVGPRTPAQRVYLEALGRSDLVFGVGPAGTGKTYLAVAHAVGLYLSGAVERIVLSRPALEAGERIGFLPGDVKEKVDPYLRPLYDALHDMLHADYIERRIAGGEFEIAPLAFMRGRTLARAAVILDEAQNATVAQTKMFLTRLGDGARMVLTGDPSQSDLPRGETSGLADAVKLLAGVEGVSIARFTAADVVRHPLVGRIIDAYDARDAAERR